MLKLAVVFGSRAAEHDVSIITGLQILENADKRKYDAYPVYISRSGEWFIGDALRDIKTYKNFDPGKKGLSKAFLPPMPGYNGLYTFEKGGLFKKNSSKAVHMDCAILAMHGMHGEDGTLQGLFELADIPYSSAGVTGSAVGMDKIIMKAVFKSMGLPVLPSKYFYRSEWKEEPEQVIIALEQLEYPLFVKPANLGSSIGINRANDREQLKHALEVAVNYDRRVLVEKGLDKPIEINCACVGGSGKAQSSCCEQPGSWTDFLTFEDKYLRGSGKGMKNLSRQIPAPISEELTKRIQDMTVQIFKMLECKGVVRVDYMMDRTTGDIFVNEINTIPGSFAFYLYEPMGIPFVRLIDMLVEGAFAALDEKRESSYAFDSEILGKAMSGLKSAK